MRIKHGHSRAKGSTSTYSSWSGLKYRCNNPNYKEYHYYGGRGITYDPKWETFIGFLEDMGEAPEGMSIDRIDVNGNYCKENCRWATAQQQTMNRRPTKIGPSGYRGVHWHKQAGKWKAQISIKGKKIHIGLFDYPWTASMAYEAKRVKETLCLY